MGGLARDDPKTLPFQLKTGRLRNGAGQYCPYRLLFSTARQSAWGPMIALHCSYLFKNSRPNCSEIAPNRTIIKTCKGRTFSNERSSTYRGLRFSTYSLRPTRYSVSRLTSSFEQRFPFPLVSY